MEDIEELGVDIGRSLIYIHTVGRIVDQNIALWNTRRSRDSQKQRHLIGNVGPVNNETSDPVQRAIGSVTP